MAGIGTMKAATMAMLLLAMVVAAAAAAMSPPDAVDHYHPAAAGGTPHRHGGGHHRSRDKDDKDGNHQTPLDKLTQCAGICGSDVASCMVTCFEPLASGKGSPMLMPVCLLGCTSGALSCGTSCSNDILIN